MEVFYYYFLKEVGIDFCVPYKLASFNGENGCLSKSFLAGDESMISLVDLMNLNYLKSKNSAIEICHDIKTDEFNEFYKYYKEEQEKNKIPYNFPLMALLLI